VETITPIDWFGGNSACMDEAEISRGMNERVERRKEWETASARLRLFAE